MPKYKGIQLNDIVSVGAIMDLKIKVKRDTDGKILNGLTVGNILNQNQGLILIAHPGENKFNPNLGVGITNVLLSQDYLGYRHKIRQQFSLDGLNVIKLDLYNNKPLLIDANY